MYTLQAGFVAAAFVCVTGVGVMLRKLLSRNTGFSKIAAGLPAAVLVLGMGVLALAVGGNAAPGHAQSLPTALSAAYDNHPAIRAERARLRSTDEQLPQALSNWRPTVMLRPSAK